MATISAATRPVDGARETIHALPALRARRATWSRRRDLGELLFAYRRNRLLDERRLHRADRIRGEASNLSRNHAPARNRERLLFDRRQVSVSEDRHQPDKSSWRLATLHTRALAKRARPGSRRICRFYRGLVSDLQVQREKRARERPCPGSIPAARGCEIEGRLDQRRPGHHEITSTIWPAGCPIIRALSGQIGGADCVSGIAHQKYPTRQTRNDFNRSCFTITYEN